MSLIEPGLAFLEGLALIVSPCILPVLPLVLSASVESGKRRPFGIIIGFVLTFSLFALASRHLINTFGIDLDIIKNSSLVLLGLFGLILLSSKLSNIFSQYTQSAANFGNTLSNHTKGGLISGIIIGGLIGLIWTPCAGPILAAVLVQVIRQESDVASLLIILPFAIGVGIPMLIIALLGRKAVNTVRFFSKHAEALRKCFGVIILLSVAFIASGVDINALFHKSENSESTFDNALQEGLADPYLAPELTGIETWLNSEPLKIENLKGKVILIDFWTYSCINCIRTLPYLTEWDKKYRDQGLVIIGIHAPEFEFEKNKTNVEKALAQYGIQYPVALDNQLDTWTNFKNHYWPAHYLINSEGQVVYTHFGEGQYAQTENNIRFLLGLNKAIAHVPEKSATSIHQTPETYLGYQRSKNFSSAVSVVKNAEQQYVLPKALPLNHWGLQGKWQIEKQRIIAGESKAIIKIHFNAKKVFLVLGTTDGKSAYASLRLNNKPLGQAAGSDTQQSKIVISSQKLYELIQQENVQSGILEIQAESANLEAYAFTFGS